MPSVIRWGRGLKSKCVFFIKWVCFIGFLTFVIIIYKDEERMDLVRVMITGPVDTPYSYGCFVFDIYYPVNYPVNPPLVVLTTTGNGTIR